MSFSDPLETKSWKKLKEHSQNIRDLDLKKAFQEDPERAERFVMTFEDLHVDYSKNLITAETENLLDQLAQELSLQEEINAYFRGEKINRTEDRAVLHTALRAKEEAQVFVEEENIIPEVIRVREKMRMFTESIIGGSRKGYTGKSFTDVVNIGIGGSDLGPAMVAEALKFYSNHLRIHFVSNVDGDHVEEVIQTLNPETTLFVVVSKSFSTQETLTNAETIRSWFLRKAPQDAVAKHFVAVSSNVSAVVDFGMHEENIFPMWDWVGGRFSLWSAVGLSISLAIGPENFEAMLSGARKMDEHFKGADLTRNIPVRLALLTFWYNNLLGSETQAIIPYSQYLSRFPAYLQQAIMESNGKGVDRNGKKVSYQTGNIIWGEPGTNSQHAFFQLIHQGTKIIPADFIGFRKSLHGNQDHHDILMANFFAQTEALMKGKSEEEVRSEMLGKGFSKARIERLLPFRIFEGNRPTTTILFEQLTPEALGKLIALYEHQIFVQGVLWNIYSYDQWGVELGKQLADRILADLKEGEIEGHDSSTTNLLKFYLR